MRAGVPLWVLLLALSGGAQGYFAFSEHDLVDTVESWVPFVPRFWVGVSAGFGLGGMRGSEITGLRRMGYTTSVRGAPNAELGLGMRLHPQLEVSGGVRYMTKGFKVAGSSASRSATSDPGTASRHLTHYQTLKADYLEGHLLLRPLRSYNFGQTNVHIFGGPSLGVPLSVQVVSYIIEDRRSSTGYGYTTASQTRTYSVTELMDGIPLPDSSGAVVTFPFAQVYRPWDLSIVMGCGFEQVAGERLGFFGEARYTVSLTGFNRYSSNVQERITHTVGEDATYLNKRFQVLYAAAGLRWYW